MIKERPVMQRQEQRSDSNKKPTTIPSFVSLISALLRIKFQNLK